MSIENLDKIFHPKSIAVVGASEREGSIGAAGKNVEAANAMASCSFWHSCCSIHSITWGVVRGIREFVMKPLAKVVQKVLNEKEEN
jgi:hypothetical protein